MCLAPSRALTATDSDAGRITTPSMRAGYPFLPALHYPRARLPATGPPQAPRTTPVRPMRHESYLSRLPRLPHLPSLRPAPRRPRQHARRHRLPPSPSRSRPAACRPLRRARRPKALPKRAVASRGGARKARGSPGSFTPASTASRVPYGAPADDFTQRRIPAPAWLKLPRPVHPRKRIKIELT